MSDFFITLMLQRLSPQEAAETRARLLSALVSEGWLTPADGQTPEAGDTFFPTAALIDSCLWLKQPNAFAEFGELTVTSGIAFDGSEIGQIETLTCPSCLSASGIDAVFPALDDTIEAFQTTGRIGTLKCPVCGKCPDVRDWRSDPLLTFAHLTLEVRGWPLFDADSWSVDFPALIENICGSPVTQSWSRL